MKAAHVRPRQVLVVARSFPPFQSVGHSIRAVKFIKYLPALGWTPTVLTIDDRREYERDRRQGSEALLRDIPREVAVHRTAAGEPSVAFLEWEQAFGRRNRLTGFMVKMWGGARRWGSRNLLLPDRTVVWLPFAVHRGRQVVRREDIDVILATSPPYSVALIGAVLKRLTGKPLILDFRDDWIDTPWYQSKPRIVRIIHRKMERWAVSTADKVILVTERSKAAFIERYPRVPPERFTLVPNGCDLEDFALVRPRPPEAGNGRFRIVHAGSLVDTHPWRRSLTGLFEALRALRESEPELSKKVTVVFAGGLPETQRQLANDMGLAGMVEEVGHLPHQEVLHLLGSADLLLAVNYEDWSTIIPAKIYEYWAVGGPPVLLLSCPGAAADLVLHHNLGFAVEPHDAEAIGRAIATVYRQSRTTNPWRVSTAGIGAYDREALTRQLVQILSSSTA